MAPLRFNMDGMTYQDGIRILWKSYRAAQDALDNEIDNSQSEAMAYQESLAKGGEWIGERDDDGVVIWDYGTQLGYLVKDAEEAAHELRKAFCITLYHHWERSARKWTGESQLKHPDLVAKVKGLSYPIDPKLEELRILVNLLKHNDDNWGRKLACKRPDLLWDSVKNMKGGVNWNGVIAIRSNHVKEFFEVIKASGPTIKTLRPPPEPPA